MFLGVARVHAAQVGRKQPGFVAAGAGADLDDHVAFVIRVLGHQHGAQLGVQVGDLAPQRLDLGARHLGHFGVVARRHRFRVGQLLPRLLADPIGLHNALQFALLAGQFGVARVIVGHGRVAHLRRQLLIAGLETREFSSIVPPTRYLEMYSVYSFKSFPPSLCL